MSTKRSLSFYRSWWEKGNEKDDKIRLEFYDAILNYAFAGVIGDMSPVVKDLFDMIKPVIDMAIIRGEAAQKRGERGGAPKGNQNARKDFGGKKSEAGATERKAEKPEPQVIDYYAEERAEVKAGLTGQAGKGKETESTDNKFGETYGQRKERLINQVKNMQTT